MRRREFIALLSGATVAWPRAARAQQPAMPVVGFLNISSPGASVLALAGLRRGLEQFGYIEGRNIIIEYRWANGEVDRLPALAADLIRRQVAVIFAGGPPAVRAAKSQSATIAIVFFIGEDPIKEGLVASFNQPGGNVTGVTNFQNQLFGKQLGLLREIAPRATAFAFLVNLINPNAEADTKDTQAAADALGLKLRVLTAKPESDFEPAFSAMAQQHVGGLIVGVDNLFFDQRKKLFALASSLAIPAIYHRREYAAAGGLMSYGTNSVDSWQQAGIYVGRILKGEKPADLPVLQSTKFEFVINLQTARALGIEVPAGLLSIADEVIE
jgi:putative ABC transport system substrate-binding protein